jgi:putative ABC transport system permease protein
MMSSEVFTYLPQYTNPVYLSGIPEYNNFLYKTFGSTEKNDGIELDSYDGNTDLYYCVNCAWVGKGVLETYGLNPECGRFFDDEDLVAIHMGDTVPIILGADYKKYYNLGDHIKGDMMIANVQFEVIGFLEKSAAMKLVDIGQSKFVQLDDFVIVPLSDYPNTIGTADEDAQRTIYSMKINGFVYSDKDPDTIQTEVNRICGEIGYEPKLKVQSSSNYEDTELLMDMSTLTNIAFVLSLILVIFSVMTFCLTMVNSIRNNMRYYAVLITNGYTYSDIAIIILTAPLLVETAALISGSIIMLIIGGFEYISLLLTCILCTLVIALIIFAIISVVTMREFKCHDLANYLRKK